MGNGSSDYFQLFNLVNNSPSEIFITSRGLRQGDPLSPFLFILMMEGLARSIKYAKSMGKIKGLQLTENGQTLTHQQFVDDTMLQGIPTVKEALAYNQILNVFPMETGLDDEDILSKVLGAKLWWQWVQEPKAHWARIWKEKYVSAWHTNDLIRMSGNIKGSYIWNRAWDNRSIVQKNSFWEIRAGDLAIFWEDKWQKEPMILKEDFFSLKQEIVSQGLNKVKDFWDISQIQGKWRSWRSIDFIDDNPMKIKAEALRSLLKQRMVLVTEGQDQLRWGNNNKGIFNLMEAKGILLGLDSSVLGKTWQHLWKYQGWMKIKIFMWLVHHKKILTWDNIRKRGVLGPSRCQLCEELEETMEHILNSFSYTTWLWDYFSNILQ
eukprot:PITA_30148